MSHTPRRCDCGKPTGDAYVCKDCAHQAREHLHTIAALAVHTDARRARWRAIDYTTRGAGRPADTPTPYDPRVTKVLAPIVTGLAGTHNIICEGRGWHLAIPRPAGISDVSRWLLPHVDWLRTRPEGVAELAFLRRSADALSRLFDRPPDRLYLGRCETVIEVEDDGTETTCEAHVYVERTKALAPTATCPRCKATIDVQERRTEFQDAVRIYQATMRELVNLAPLFLTEGVSRRTLQEWTRHRLLLPVGTRLERDAQGRERRTPTYRVGDLDEAANVWARTLDERKARRSRGRNSA